MEQMTAPLSVSCPLDGSGGFCVLPALERSESLALVQARCVYAFTVAMGKGAAGSTLGGHLGYMCVTQSVPPSLSRPLPPPDQDGFSCSDGESSSHLLLPRRKKPQGPWQQPYLLCPLARMHPLGGPGSPTQPGPASQSPEAPDPAAGVWGVSGSDNARGHFCCHSSVPRFVYSSQNHMEVPSAMPIPHHEGPYPILSVFPR